MAINVVLNSGFGGSCGSSDFNMITEISDPVGGSAAAGPDYGE